MTAALPKNPKVRKAELEQTHQHVTTYAPDLLERSFDVARRAAELQQRIDKGAVVKDGPGRPPNTEKNGDVITINETGKGTSADYLTRRLARDHPRIFERMRAGEYRSVRAAALEAGIVPRTVTVRVAE